MLEALWRLGGVPEEHRTDNLSAATHELAKSRGRWLTGRYRELLEHYALRGSKNTPGQAHENGDVESSNRGFKNALDQRLRLRGSRDFDTVEGAGNSSRPGWASATALVPLASPSAWRELEEDGEAGHHHGAPALR